MKTNPSLHIQPRQLASGMAFDIEAANATIAKGSARDVVATVADWIKENLEPAEIGALIGRLYDTAATAKERAQAADTALSRDESFERLFPKAPRGEVQLTHGREGFGAGDLW